MNVRKDSILMSLPNDTGKSDLFFCALLNNLQVHNRHASTLCKRGASREDAKLCECDCVDRLANFGWQKIELDLFVLFFVFLVSYISSVLKRHAPSDMHSKEIFKGRFHFI